MSGEELQRGLSGREEGPGAGSQAEEGLGLVEWGDGCWGRVAAMRSVTEHWPRVAVRKVRSRRVLGMFYARPGEPGGPAAIGLCSGPGRASSICWQMKADSRVFGASGRRELPLSKAGKTERRVQTPCAWGK